MTNFGFILVFFSVSLAIADDDLVFVNEENLQAVDASLPELSLPPQQVNPIGQSDNLRLRFSNSFPQKKPYMPPIGTLDGDGVSLERQRHLGPLLGGIRKKQRKNLLPSPGGKKPPPPN